MLPGGKKKNILNVKKRQENLTFFDFGRGQIKIDFGGREKILVVSDVFPEKNPVKTRLGENIRKFFLKKFEFDKKLAYFLLLYKGINFKFHQQEQEGGYMCGNRPYAEVYKRKKGGF